MARLIIGDYDGTIADTYTFLPGMTTYRDAHRQVIERILGVEGLGVFESLPHKVKKGQAMIRIVELMMENGNADMLHKRALDFYNTNHDLFDQKDGLSTNDKIPFVTELIVQQKMQILEAQIDQSWPMPCSGFCEFYSEFVTINKSSDQEFAILSAGNTGFIRRSFDTWGLKMPDIVVTSDEMRHLPIPHTEKVKPNPRGYYELMSRWMWQHRTMEVPDAVYVGDDRERDGGLAKAAGIPFIWFNDSHTGSIEEGYAIVDWRELGECL